MATVWGAPILILAAGTMFCIGCLVCKRVLRTLGEKDPQIIVVDEVAGQWLALSTAPLDPLYYGLSFVLFRVADIWKIWPASWADRSLSGSLGVMLDDAISGVYAAMAVFAVVLIVG
jgi:phosphatidylglycerophosphatase A